MFQKNSNISDASAIDQFKKFSCLALGVSLFGVAILNFIGAIAIVCAIRAWRLFSHKAIQKLEDRNRYLVIAGVGGVLGVLGLILSFY